MATPDYNLWLSVIWGAPFDFDGAFPGLSIASNVIVGGNPPYSITDFLTMYPNFGGKPALPTGTIDGVTAIVTNVSSIVGLLAGQYVSGPGIAPGSTIVSAVGTTVTLNKPTTQALTPVQLTVYVKPLIPMVVMNAYLFLAVHSLFIGRWGEMWWSAIALYIAHWCTLWALAQATPANANLAQIVAAGLASGLSTGQSAGDASYSVQPILIEGMGAWNQTEYGLQLATFAQVVGSGSMLLW